MRFVCNEGLYVLLLEQPDDLRQVRISRMFPFQVIAGGMQPLVSAHRDKSRTVYIVRDPFGHLIRLQEQFTEAIHPLVPHGYRRGNDQGGFIQFQHHL